MDVVQKAENLTKTNTYTEVTPKLRAAILGRYAEGTPWAARDEDDDRVYFFPQKPSLCQTGFCQSFFEKMIGSSNSPIYDFVTFENSPIYLLDLIFLRKCRCPLLSSPCHSIEHPAMLCQCLRHLICDGTIANHYPTICFDHSCAPFSAPVFYVSLFTDYRQCPTSVKNLHFPSEVSVNPIK